MTYAAWPATRHTARSALEPLHGGLVLDGDGLLDRRGRGLLDLAADQRHLGLELGVEGLDGAVAVGPQREGALERDGSAGDAHLDRALAAAVVGGRAPVLGLGDLEGLPDHGP